MNPVQRRFNRLAAAANQKAAKVGEDGRITADDLARIYLQSEGSCTYCGIDIEALDCSFDHVTAYDRGGQNQPDNIVACCMTCQRSKFTKDPAEYAQWRELRRVCPIDGTIFRPRWADYKRGLGIYCSRRCSGAAGGAS